MISKDVNPHGLSVRVAFYFDLMGRGVNHLLVANLDEDEPTVVPTTGAGRISNGQRLRFVQALRAKGIVSSHATEFAEKVVGVDIVSPGASERLPNFLWIKQNEELFDAT